MPDNNLRNLANKIYSSNNKIGKRYFQSKEDIFKLYSLAKFNDFKYIGRSKELIVSEIEHVSRYDVNFNEIKKIQDLILKYPLNKFIFTTKKGYLMKFIFPIYVAYN